MAHKNPADRNAYFKRWYAKNKERHIGYIRAVEAKHKEAFRLLLDEAKSRPCLDCGGCFPPCAMDFDHVRGSKVGHVSQMVRRTNASIDRVKAEIAKCEVVCANCHRIRTEARRLAAKEVAA